MGISLPSLSHPLSHPSVYQNPPTHHLIVTIKKVQQSRWCSKPSSLAQFGTHRCTLMHLRTASVCRSRSDAEEKRSVDCFCRTSSCCGGSSARRTRICEKSEVCLLSCSSRFPVPHAPPAHPLTNSFCMSWPIRNFCLLNQIRCGRTARLEKQSHRIGCLVYDL